MQGSIESRATHHERQYIVQLALIKLWQTAALLILILGFALAPSLPGYLVPTLPLDWLGVLLPFGATVISMHLGRHRLAALCSVAGACVSAASSGGYSMMRGSGCWPPG